MVILIFKFIVFTIKSITLGFYDDIMMLMNEKLSSLKIKKYDDILSDISKILDSDEVVTN